MQETLAGCVRRNPSSRNVIAVGDEALGFRARHIWLHNPSAECGFDCVQIAGLNRFERIREEGPPDSEESGGLACVCRGEIVRGGAPLLWEVIGLVGRRVVPGFVAGGGRIRGRRRAPRK
jgi:hypothetical protein